MKLDEFEDLVSTISERCFCAGWQSAMEFRLWLVVVGANDTELAQSNVSDLELQKLRSHLISEKTWIIFRDGPTLIPLAEWLPLVDQFRKAPDSFIKLLEIPAF